MDGAAAAGATARLRMVLSGMALSGMALSGMALSGTALSGTALSGMALSGMALSGTTPGTQRLQLLTLTTIDLIVVAA